MFALADANNCSASFETVFRPDLRGDRLPFYLSAGHIRTSVNIAYSADCSPVRAVTYFFTTADAGLTKAPEVSRRDI